MGILQGATEFLPISSSGHLVLAQIFFNIEEVGLAFDVSLHLGTLLAVIIYFRNDFIQMGLAFVKFDRENEEQQNLRKLAYYICFATVPAVLAALVLGDAAETVFRKSWVVAITLTVGGLLILWAERAGKHTRDFWSVTLKDAMTVGFAQALAIIPGVSRSGITMTAGLFVGLNRQSVARFSFLLSAPIILGAGVYEMPKIIEQGLSDGNTTYFLAGFVSSAISGYLVIAFLLNFIRTRTFDIFAYYRFALAALVVIGLVLF